jgi:NhaP-type Na+/H+ or K+/H+ antiporter
MLISGIILGPYVLNLIDPGLLSISLDLRQIALIIILFRAGLTLDLKDLKRIGKTAILLSFIPATFELIAITLLAPLFFNITYLEARLWDRF